MQLKKSNKYKLTKQVIESSDEQARKLSLESRLGEDLSLKAPSKIENRTMFNLGEEYLRRHAKLNKKPKGYQEDETFLNKIILKKYGHLNVENVSAFDLQGLHAELQRTPYRANKIRALLSKMFSLAIQWRWRSDNPVKGIEKYQEYQRHRLLNDEELQRLWLVLETYHNQSIANAIRLLLLTGSRCSEVLHATWEQFDLAKGLWIKPAHATKLGRIVYLPLSSQTIKTLQNIKDGSTSNFLFPGKISGKPLQDIKKAWYTIRKKADLSDVRLHDLRHTHAAHLISSGLSLSIVGKLLGHTQASTTQRYAHLADEPLRQAAELFGSKLHNLTSAGF